MASREEPQVHDTRGLPDVPAPQETLFEEDPTPEETAEASATPERNGETPSQPAEGSGEVVSPARPRGMASFPGGPPPVSTPPPTMSLFPQPEPAPSAPSFRVTTVESTAAFRPAGPPPPAPPPTETPPALAAEPEAAEDPDVVVGAEASAEPSVAVEAPETPTEAAAEAAAEDKSPAASPEAQAAAGTGTPPAKPARRTRGGRSRPRERGETTAEATVTGAAGPEAAAAEEPVMETAADEPTEAPEAAEAAASAEAPPATTEEPVATGAPASEPETVQMPAASSEAPPRSRRRRSRSGRAAAQAGQAPAAADSEAETQTMAALAAAGVTEAGTDELPPIPAAPGEAAPAEASPVDRSAATTELPPAAAAAQAEELPPAAAAAQAQAGQDTGQAEAGTTVAEEEAGQGAAEAEIPEGTATAEPTGGGSSRTRARRRRRAAAKARLRSGEPGEAGEAGEAAAEAPTQQTTTPADQPTADQPTADQPAPARTERPAVERPRGIPTRGPGRQRAAASATSAATETPTEEPTPTRGRARGRRRAAARAQDEAAATVTEPAPARTPAPTERSTRLEASRARGTRQGQAGDRGRRRRRSGLTEDQKRVLREGPERRMLVTEGAERTQIGVIEGRTLVEHYVTRKTGRSMVGNIYLGRVQNVLPGMEAAFIDIGKGRNAVLYAGEVNYNEEDLDGEAPRIEKALKPGQSILVQVTKDPIGAKGARLTTQVSLAGRYLVLQPEDSTFGISRRLPEGERIRLREILKEVRPKGLGLIVRTAADGATADDLRADLARLQARWETIERKAKKASPPAVMYQEPELVVRVIRDIFSPDFVELVVDAPGLYERVKAYLEEVAPDLLPRVRAHDGRLALFEQYRVTEQIHKALERKVWLPSGGSLVIDQTEAMTVVDVNTGKYVGKSNLEETVVATNLEAAEEIVRQLRLRDIGGIIIIDFIDMLFEKNQQAVVERLRSALARDKTKSQVMEVSSLGLVQMTRKRVSGGLLDSFSETCPTCEGRGVVITHEV
jgi:ribonuclease E